LGREEQLIEVQAHDIVIFEGILALHDPFVKNLMSLKIFINCDLDVALGRRIIRDTVDRGRNVKETLQRYFKFVKESYEEYVKPVSPIFFSHFRL
jgi:uridine kinase